VISLPYDSLLSSYFVVPHVVPPDAIDTLLSRQSSIAIRTERHCYTREKENEKHREEGEKNEEMNSRTRTKKRAKGGNIQSIRGWVTLEKQRETE